MLTGGTISDGKQSGVNTQGTTITGGTSKVARPWNLGTLEPWNLGTAPYLYLVPRLTTTSTRCNRLM